MDRFYLLEFSYRSLYFLNFLNDSLKNWESIGGETENYQNLTLIEKQYKFRDINKSNLLNYQENEKKNDNFPKNINNYKAQIIKDWAKSKKINISKNLSFNELDEISDKIFKIYITLLNKLKSENNFIINLCFSQIINNLFGLVILLNELKGILIKDKNFESDQYTKLIIELNEKENIIKNYMKNEKILKQVLKKEENKVKILKDKNDILNEYNQNLFLLNEKFQSLKCDLDNQKKLFELEREEREKQLKSLLNELEKGRIERENMKAQLEKGRIERENLMLKIKNYFENTEDFVKKQKQDFVENFLNK